MRAWWGATSSGMIPLPAALDGELMVRSVKIDRALLYLLNAAITGLVDKQRYVATGTLTVDDALTALETMIKDYYDQP